MKVHRLCTMDAAVSFISDVDRTDRQACGGMQPIDPTLTNRRRDRRSGVTLMDVLMSLMIMSIGIISAASLFPISVIRSIQATQMTHATTLRLNAETILTLKPWLVHNPDFDVTTTHYNELYIVDPLGWHSHEQQGTGDEDSFGGLMRYGEFLVGSLEEAATLVSLPDSWVTAIVWDKISAGPTSAVLEKAKLHAIKDVLDDTDIPVRLVIEGLDGKQSIIQHITTSPPNAITLPATVSWTDDLPNTPNFAEVSKIRIQIQEQHYTWLLTVRSSREDHTSKSTTASVDLVVFFNRSPSKKDETVYDAHFTTVAPLQKEVIVKYAGTKPLVKKGGYIFDAENAYWYRIQDYELDSGNSEFTITIARPEGAIAQSTDASSSRLDPKGKAILMRGIIAVFPLGSFKK